jgi:5'-3' exonuclease
MVAPYEADCQLAKLKNLNLIDVAISEDSDLLVYGVNTILKLNQNGDCDYVDLKKWGPRDVDQQFLKEFLAMNWINRIDVAILAGSDYNPSIYGIGIIRAVKNIYRQVSMKNVINKLKMTKLYAQRIPDGYDELVEKVKMIFLFATVFNPIDRKL